MALTFALPSWAERIRRNHAVKSAGVLVGGTAAAQFVAVIALPILTRIYSPTDFTVLATYSSLLFMLSYPATGRFDMAIPLAAEDSEAMNLLTLATLSSIFTAALLAGLLLFFGVAFAHAMSIDRTEKYLWLLPFSVAMAGTFIGFQSWWIRRKAFGAIATNRLGQVTTGVGIQLGLGVAGWKPIGLLIGHLMIAGAGSINLVRRFWRDDRHLFASVSLRSLWRTAYANRQYPQYSVADSLAATAGENLPIVIIAALSKGPEAGLLLLTVRVLGAPVQLIANAVAQVYLSNVARAHREGRLKAATRKLVRALILFGSAPLLFGSFAAAPLFGIIFGEQWATAGAMMMWVAPWYAVRLATMPLISLPALLGRQAQMMFIRVTTLLIRLAAVYLGFYYWNGRVVEALAISSFLHWSLLMALFYSLAGIRLRDLGLSFFAVPVIAALSGYGVAHFLVSPLL